MFIVYVSLNTIYVQLNICIDQWQIKENIIRTLLFVFPHTPCKYYFFCLFRWNYLFIISRLPNYYALTYK